MKAFYLSAICLVISSVSGFSWGEEGHQAIADAAFNLLNPAAKKAVSDTLDQSSIIEIEDLHSAATWPDDIRQSSHPGKFVNTKGGKSFNKRFVGNKEWHFVDYPLDGDYNRDMQFSSPTDVVHIIKNCVLVLENKSDAKFAKMKQEEALAWLIHLVGDVHQPLHVGVGFYDFQGSDAILVTDPAQAVGKFTDIGGNSVHFGSSGVFHSFWDADMVSSVSTKEPTVVADIASRIAAEHFANAGDYHNFAEAWATDTIKEAKKAYEGVTTAHTFGQRDAVHSDIIDIKLTTSTYKTKLADVVRRQLAKAAFDLADILNNVNWP